MRRVSRVMQGQYPVACAPAKLPDSNAHARTHEPTMSAAERLSRLESRMTRAAEEGKGVARESSIGFDPPSNPMSNPLSSPCSNPLSNPASRSRAVTNGEGFGETDAMTIAMSYRLVEHVAFSASSICPFPCMDVIYASLQGIV
eukprot:5758258-Pleurochrysis_carterae.AAC.2